MGHGSKIVWMSRRIRALFLWVVLMGQLVAVLGSATVTQRADEIEHLAVHFQEINHHHHADHALHIDADGPLQHLHADPSPSAAALLTGSQPALTDVSAMSPPEVSHVMWLSPMLEGPLRPPMPRA